MINRNLSQDGIRFMIHKLINVIYCMNKLKNKNYMMIFIGAQRLLIKFNVHYDRNSPQICIEKTYLYIIKTVYNKPIANYMFNDKMLKAFPLREQDKKKKKGNKTEYLLSSLYNIGVLVKMWRKWNTCALLVGI